MSEFIFCLTCGTNCNVIFGFMIAWIMEATSRVLRSASRQGAK